jgi:NADPH:quinone reductase-like Zn-dependent oxidoreductase
MMARKVVYERSGEPAQVVRVVESGVPQAPHRGQVLVRLIAFSIRPGDLAGLAGPFAGADGDARVSTPRGLGHATPPAISMLLPLQARRTAYGD